MFDGSRVGLACAVIASMCVWVWFLGFFRGRNHVLKAVAGQIWNPERVGSMMLVLSNGREISPSSSSDGYFTFQCPRGTIPLRLRLRGCIFGFWPHCTVSIEGIKVVTQWEVGQDDKCYMFRDLVWEKTGSDMDCLLSYFGVDRRCPYFHPRCLVLEFFIGGDGASAAGEELHEQDSVPLWETMEIIDGQ